MRLKAYLDSTRRDGETFYMRCARFGALLGVNEYCVRKWAYRQRRIADEYKIKIELLTDGKVSLREMVKGALVMAEHPPA